MRTVTVELSGAAYQMPVNYAASRKIAEMVADPLKMAMQAYQTGALDLTTEQVIDIVHIGISCAGASLTRDQVANSMVDAGLVNFVAVVGQYVGALVSGGPEKQQAASSKKKR